MEKEKEKDKSSCLGEHGSDWSALEVLVSEEKRRRSWRQRGEQVMFPELLVRVFLETS